MSRRLAVLAVLLAGIALFFAFDLQDYLRISTLKASHEYLLGRYRQEPLLFIGAFMLLHIIALALCIPGAVLTMALAGGAFFGPAWGTLIVLTSLTIGDSLGFLAAKFVIGDWVRERFAEQLEPLEAEVDRNGALYLLSLRLMAAIPYFVINLMFGVTRMRLRTFAPASFVGLAPATALYVNAGTQIARIQSAGDVLSAPLLITFTLLACVPVAARFLFRRPAR